SADQVKSGLASAKAEKLLPMIEMDEFGREVLADFAPAEGAAERLADFVADQDSTVLVVPEAKGRLHALKARLVPEVVGFQKSGGKKKARKKPSSTKKKRPSAKKSRRSSKRKRK